MALFCDIGER